MVEMRKLGIHQRSLVKHSSNKRVKIIKSDNRWKVFISLLMPSLKLWNQANIIDL